MSKLLDQTHRFRYSRWAARRVAATFMIVLYALLLWLILGQNQQGGGVFEVIFVALVAALAVVYLFIAQHPVVRLCVGPEGISSRFGLARQITWNEIAEATYIARRPVLLPAREWILLELKPEAPALSRVPLPAKVEDWLFGKSVRIPLHVLSAPSGEVLGSMERFMPVTEADIELEPVSVGSTPRL